MSALKCTVHKKMTLKSNIPALFARTILNGTLVVVSVQHNGPLPMVVCYYTTVHYYLMVHILIRARPDPPPTVRLIPKARIVVDTQPNTTAQKGLICHTFTQNLEIPCAGKGSANHL